MSPDDILHHLPYPIASVYTDLDRADASPQTHREALFFSCYCYQLMRTVGLTLVSQYLTQPVPPSPSTSTSS